MSFCADMGPLVGFSRTYSGSQEGIVTAAMLSLGLEQPDGTAKTVHQFSLVLKAKNVKKTEFANTKEAASLIASSSYTDEIRELKKISKRIVGNYLLHYQKFKSTVCYTTDMVKTFLTKEGLYLGRSPGVSELLFLRMGMLLAYLFSARLRSRKKWRFHLYGDPGSMLAQELEAVALCACNYLSGYNYVVKIQLYPCIDEDMALGQLGFPVFVAILSAVYNRLMDGMCFGVTPLLGGLTGSICDSRTM